MTMRVVFSADWHLSRLTWSQYADLRGDAYFSLRQLIDFCIQHNCQHLIAAGDLFDKDRPDSASVGVLHAELTRAQTHGIQIYYIQGQHEKADPPWLATHPWPQHVDRKRFEIPGVPGVFYGLDWQPAGAINQTLTEIPADVTHLVCHQVWREHMGNLPSECSVHEIGRDITILTGDYHVHQMATYAGTQPNGRLTNCLMLSPGSISMRKVDEDPQKGFWVWCDVQGWVSARIHTRPFGRFQLDAIEGLPAFRDAVDRLVASAAALPEELRRPAIYVSYDPMATGLRQAIMQTCAGRAHLFENQLVTASDPQLISANADEQTPVTVLDCAAQFIAKDQPAYALLQQLLGDEDTPARELVARIFTGV